MFLHLSPILGDWQGISGHQDPVEHCERNDREAGFMMSSPMFLTGEQYNWSLSFVCESHQD